MRNSQQVERGQDPGAGPVIESGHGPGDLHNAYLAEGGSDVGSNSAHALGSDSDPAAAGVTRATPFVPWASSRLRQSITPIAVVAVGLFAFSLIWQLTGFEGKAHPVIGKFLLVLLGTLVACSTIRGRRVLESVGYSSLTHLRILPIDELKIDKSFIAAMETSPQASTLVHSLIQLWAALGIATVAEGIEGPQQLRHLQNEECLHGQGFFISPPLDRGVLRTYLKGEGQTDESHPTGGARA